MAAGLKNQETLDTESISTCSDYILSDTKVRCKLVLLLNLNFHFSLLVGGSQAGEPSCVYNVYLAHKRVSRRL